METVSPKRSESPRSSGNYRPSKSWYKQVAALSGAYTEYNFWLMLGKKRSVVFVSCFDHRVTILLGP